MCSERVHSITLFNSSTNVNDSIMIQVNSKFSRSFTISIKKLRGTTLFRCFPLSQHSIQCTVWSVRGSIVFNLFNDHLHLNSFVDTHVCCFYVTCNVNSFTAKLQPQLANLVCIYVTKQYNATLLNAMLFETFRVTHS